MHYLQFPDGFRWGVATSAYQIEGAVTEDGRGESIWDRFSHTPGRTRDGDTGDVACDHYHRWPDDVALMADLGIGVYRFSINWPRIFPTGRRTVNARGLDFYDRLVDGLLEAGITPMPTLYHWELPQALEDEGGWPLRQTAEAFAEFTAVVADRLGDRVKEWITHNEPYCTAILGYQDGVHAPGRRNWHAAIRAAHHVLLSHGMAADVLRAAVPGGRLGIAVNFEPAYPASDDPAAHQAAERFSGYYYRWLMDPLFGRGYPEDMIDHYSAEGYLPNGLDFVEDGDFDLISRPIDFLGINYYTRHLSASDETLDQLSAEVVPGADYTAIGWEVRPEAFEDLLTWITREYSPRDIIITENGCSYPDGPGADGGVHDARRIRYLQQHIAAVHRAIEEGAPVSGYLQWSLMDNFEWSHGYHQRFGIVYVDYETQERIPKESAYWYRDVIARNGVET